MLEKDDGDLRVGAKSLVWFMAGDMGHRWGNCRGESEVERGFGNMGEILNPIHGKSMAINRVLDIVLHYTVSSLGKGLHF